jgi:hypothetical protein
MTRSLATIEKEILELDTSSQEELLRVLVEALDGPPDAGADAAWLEEAQRRSEEIDSGVVECVPAEEVFRKVDARLKK